MRRFVLAALAVLAAGGAFFLREKSRSTSFSAYTEAQLDTLEANYRALSREPPTQGTLAAREEATLDAQLSLEWLQTERHRRLSLRAFALVALLAAVGALLPRRRGSRRDRGEDARLRKAMGDPEVLLEGERHKAARLLGVTPEAPPAVIDAALAAQLAAHDPGRVDGLAPEVRRMILRPAAGTAARPGPPGAGADRPVTGAAPDR